MLNIKVLFAVLQFLISKPSNSIKNQFEYEQINLKFFEIEFRS
jgi:hypothetical protein